MKKPTDSTATQFAVNLPPAAWAQDFLTQVPDLRTTLSEAGESFQKQVLNKKWSDWSLLPMAGWYSIAVPLFDFKSGDGEMDYEEFMMLNNFITAMAWSYEQVAYVVHSHIGNNNANKASVLSLPSRALINLTHGHKYAFYIAFNNEVVDGKPKKSQPSKTEEDGLVSIDGVMVVMIDEMTPPDCKSNPEITLMMVSGRQVSPVSLKVGDWTIGEAAIEHFKLELGVDDDEALARTKQLIPILNVVMFLATDQAKLLAPENITRTDADLRSGIINPDVRFLALDSVIGSQDREWMAIEAPGGFDVQFAAIN